jgi:hypothetical protein
MKISLPLLATITASDRIVANSAIDKVNAGSTQQYVVSVTTEQRVVA